GLIARRIVRPLSDLVRVTREIGAGKLKSRVRLGRHHRGEVGVLADSINDMAIRIERQMREQRELLAAVSHEIRSPLSRMRVLVELLRERAPDQKRIDQLERELVEIDSLVGKLLASSRLDFEALSWHLLVAGDMARRAVERCGLSLDLVRDRSEGATFEGDATLVERALANLIENAVQHAGSVQAVDVATEGDKVQFEVHDLGAGFAPAALQRAFEPFYRGESASGKNGPSASNSGAPSGSLGLGLALVHRIATAHGGRAWAKNRPEGGASVGFCVRRRG
ncbi:MAG TPA: HAMP domain-containing sensor histidine kinase, partial [Polyangiaceae bacterium]